MPTVVLSYGRDNIGNVVSIADAINGATSGLTAHTYDARDRLTRILQSGNGVQDKRVDLSYNAVGQPTRIDRSTDLGGTLVVADTTYEYDNLNRLTELVHRRGSTLIGFETLAYDPASRITQVTDGDGTTAYDYDDRDQIRTADHSAAANPDEAYNYDPNGNRASSHLHGVAYATGLANRLASDGIFNYDYDREGNITHRTEIGTGRFREFQWDHRNRLTAVVDNDVTGMPLSRVDYTYDALNRRIAKAVDRDLSDALPAALTSFVYDGDDVWLEFLDADGAGVLAPVLSMRYLDGPAVDQVLAQEDVDGDVLWLLTDHLGTTHDLIDSAGQVQQHLTYDSFGNVISQTDPTLGTRYLFTGRELDEETGLYYYRARYFDAAVGRFLSEDPTGFADGYNPYRYVGNSPVSRVDPTGLESNVFALLRAVFNPCEVALNRSTNIPDSHRGRGNPEIEAEFQRRLQDGTFSNKPVLLAFRSQILAQYDILVGVVPGYKVVDYLFDINDVITNPGEKVVEEYVKKLIELPFVPPPDATLSPEDLKKLDALRSRAEKIANFAEVLYKLRKQYVESQKK